MKRIISLILVAVMVFSIMPLSVLAVEDLEFVDTYGVTYKLSEDGKYYSVVDFSVLKTDVIIEAKINKLPVQVIETGAFAETTSQKKKLTSIVIPNSIIKINASAFVNCDQLTSIELGDSLEEIGGCAFEGCKSLTKITIPASVSSIGYRAFVSCDALSTIKVNSANKVFHSKGNCIIETKTKKLVLGGNNSVIPSDGSVTSLGDYCFSTRSGITNITIPDSIVLIGVSAFEDCTALEEIDIPDFVSDIQAQAFWGCSALSNVHIPDSVKHIGSYAFADCISLTSIDIPDSVVAMGENVFIGSNNLTEIRCEADTKPKGWNENWNNGCSVVEKWGEDINYFEYPHINLTNTGNALEYPVFNESAYAKQLEEWIENGKYFEGFAAFIDQGYTYKDLLYYTIDMPAFADDGTGYSIESSVCVKDVMSYLVFSDLTQKYMKDVINQVRKKFENYDASAYTYFFDRIKNFNSRYLSFQKSVNGKDTFNQTLYTLMLAKTALTLVDTIKVTYTSGEIKHIAYGSNQYKVLANMQTELIKETVSLKTYAYITDMYKATVEESPELYDNLYYYLLSGGDEQYLNETYRENLKDYGWLLKNGKNIFKAVKNSGKPDAADIVTLVFNIDNVSYFAERFNYEGADIIKTAKNVWNTANTALDMIKAISAGSLFGVAGAAYKLSDAFINEVKKVYDDAKNTDAGWYALAYYYLGEKNPEGLKGIVDPDTGSVMFTNNTLHGIVMYGNPFDRRDIIQKYLQNYFEKNLWGKQKTYNPSEELRLYLWNACNTALNIKKIDCTSYRNWMLQYLLAELNLENGACGAHFDVSVSANDNELGTVTGGGVYAAGTQVTLCANPIEDVTFVGWKNVDTGAIVSYAQRHTVDVFASINLQAVFEDGRVHVAQVPTITLQPANNKYTLGDSVTALEAGAVVNDGGTITYDWYRSYVNSSDSGYYVASGKTFTPPINAVGEIYYYAIVTNQSVEGGIDSSIKTNVVKIEVVENEYYYYLKEKIEEAETISYEIYSKESFAQLEKAISNAYSELNLSVSGETYAEHTHLLSTAIENLQERYIVGIYAMPISSIYYGNNNLESCLSVYCVYDNDTQSQVEQYDVKNFDCYKLGLQQVIITYEGLSCTASIDVRSDTRRLYELYYALTQIDTDDFAESGLTKVRELYTVATQLLNAEYPSVSEVENTVAKIESLISQKYSETILSVESYSTTAPNYNYAGNTSLFHDDGIRLTDGIKNTAYGSSNAYSAWGSGVSVEIVLKLTENANSDKFKAYFACDEWGVKAPKNMRLQYSSDGMQWNDIQGTLSRTLVSDGIDDSNWSLYCYSFKAIETVKAQYIKFIIVPNDSFVWMDEVEVISTKGECVENAIIINGVNQKIAQGSCVLFTSEFGEINTSTANHAWTANLIAKWNEELGMYVVTRVFSGSGLDTTPSVILNEDEILLAAHKWEGSVSNPVAGSGNNFLLVNSAIVGQRILISGIERSNNSLQIAPYAKLDETVCDIVGHNYGEWMVSIEPTPDSDGKLTLKCESCGATLQEKNMPYLEMYSVSVILESDISLKYKVEKRLFEEIGYINPYILFTFNGEQTKITDYTVDDNNYIFEFENISAHQMNDVIGATIFATYNGVEYVGETVEYSVATYCYNTLARYSTDEYAELRTLLVDLLNYGSISQEYVSYENQNLANAKLTDVQKTWGTQDEREVGTVFNQAYKTIENPMVVWKAAGLNLKDSVDLRFKLAADDIKDMSVEITTDAGERWVIHNEQFQKTVGGYYVFFDGLSVSQMSESVYVTAYVGETQASNTLRYSIESYVYAKQNDSNAKLVELITAMMKYGDSAKAYVN